jgi:hypothetical protein
MESIVCDLDLLKARTRRGDLSAAAQLRRELEPRMVTIVGQTLRAGVGRTPMSKDILERARQLAPVAAAAGASRERLIRAVARDLCESYVRDLRIGPQRYRRLQDTVCQ